MITLLNPNFYIQRYSMHMFGTSIFIILNKRVVSGAVIMKQSYLHNSLKSNVKLKDVKNSSQ